MAKAKIGSVREYLASQPRATRAVLQRVHRTIRKAIPNADETISYGILAYKVRGRVVLYLAGWKAHFSLYPATRQLEIKFKDELAPYGLSHRGTIRFPLSEPVPVGLIGRIAKFRVKESGVRATTTTATSRRARRR